MLRFIQPFLALAYQCKLRMDRWRRFQKFGEEILESRGIGVIRLNWEGRGTTVFQSGLGRHFAKSYSLPVKNLASFHQNHLGLDLPSCVDYSGPGKLIILKQNRRLMIEQATDGEPRGESLLYRMEEERHGRAVSSNHFYDLTDREIEVLQWLDQGKSNEEIGIVMGISSRTVQKHLEHVYAKLGVENRTAAAAVYRRHMAETQS
jgi:DNA-binding CsgD family transcriptional regulator